MTISEDLVDFLELDKELSKAALESNMEMDEWDDHDGYYGEQYDILRCPSCWRSHNIQHFECAEYIDICSCPEETADSVYYCNPCDVLWDVDTGEKLTINGLTGATPLFDTDEYDEIPGEAGSKSPIPKKAPGLNATGFVPFNNVTQYVPKCNHKHEKIDLFDGTAIYCSSARVSSEQKPDFGLYADSIWSPTWRNEFINWPDYGKPKDDDVSLVQIFEAYYRAKERNQMVEIGCIGGHGRTGTILAVMYLASAEGKVKADEAIKFVRNKYCTSAIESDIQEWFIAYAGAMWYGHELPEKPSESFNTSYGCSLAEHFAMMLRGHKVCDKRGSDCHFWPEDTNAFKKDHAHKTKHESESIKKAMNILRDYDYIYGGLIGLESDKDMSPCTPFDHYAMFMKGHEDKCIRLEENCNWWNSDILEWKEHGTINQHGNWNDKDTMKVLKGLYELYPSVEEYSKSKEKDKK